MTWAFKISRNPGSSIACDFECPIHGYFTATVPRDENGDPPPSVKCSEWVEYEHHCEDPPCNDCGLTGWTCEEDSPWRPTAPLGRVKAGEVHQGKVMEYPPEQVCLDTRPLADGMPLHEWRAKQEAITRDINLKRHRSRRR